MVNDASVKSISDIFDFGSLVKYELSKEVSKLVSITFKSVTCRVVDGRPPWHTPKTVATPEIVTWVVPTLTTDTKDWSDVD